MERVPQREMKIKLPIFTIIIYKNWMIYQYLCEGMRFCYCGSNLIIEEVI
ncbi:hypothetical protein HMPREF9099_03063 [Lachnospiraceae bacterium oral taxon 082 str. F0431]|jgi:hypothetical protein|nr:hypothetical protein HMPREF9099_03063 [Lachnospiraceae bacterium oral taxon 082 str. F0431]